MTPERFMRILVYPAFGIFVTTFLLLNHELAYWHLPFIAGLFAIPLIAVGRGGDEDDE